MIVEGMVYREQIETNKSIKDIPHSSFLILHASFLLLSLLLVLSLSSLTQYKLLPVVAMLAIDQQGSTGIIHRIMFPLLNTFAVSLA